MLDSVNVSIGQRNESAVPVSGNIVFFEYQADPQSPAA